MTIAQSDSALVATEGWKRSFPGAAAGLLVMSGVSNPPLSDALETHKREVEHELRSHVDSPGAGGPSDDPTVQAYTEYYRLRHQTYHVKAQWESVALKGKPIPTRAALVEAMFMAELRNRLLTAGHDRSTVKLPIQVSDTTSADSYEAINGKQRTLAEGDMMMRDGARIISSILYGPDRRTEITPDTTEVLFAVYAVPGIGEATVQAHLEDIRANVLLVAPPATTETLVTITAGRPRRLRSGRGG